MTTRLPCPKCGGNQVRVIQTLKACLNGQPNTKLRLLQNAGITKGIKRRRKCVACECLFNTIEMDVDELHRFLMAVSYLKSQLRFERQKVSQLQDELKRAEFINA